MLDVAIENQNGWNYSAPAPHKTGAGICTPMITRAHNRAKAVFFMRKAQPHSDYGGAYGAVFGRAGFSSDR